MRRVLIPFVMLLSVAACGPVAGLGTPGPTATNVAVQPGDVPSGMHKCDLSGDMNSYLKKIQAKDPSTYSTTKAQWDAAQKDGATGAEAVFYTDSTEHCAALANNGTQIGTATYKLVVNFVFQFKDQASAENGYKNDSIFGFSAASLKSMQIPAVEGAPTGLGSNSIVVSAAIANQSFYVAVWQKKQFMVILGNVNVDTAADKKMALAVDGRIH
jgi:hypothetical protein